MNEAHHKSGLRSPRVIIFLATEALSSIGSWATIVAIWGYAAYKYDAGAGDVAQFGIAFSLPPILLGPVAGTVIDRVGPKATLAFAKVIGVVASLALLSADDFRALAILSALHGVSFSFTLPALQATPPRLVEPQDLARSNALVALTDELAIVLGPLAAGVSIAAFGFRGAFVFDAATYAVGLAVLPLVRLRPAAANHDAGPTPQARLRDALEGWKLVARTPTVRRVVACTFAVHLLYGTALLAEPLYVRDVLERSETVFAALQTAFGLCLVAGGLLAARLGERLASFGWVALGVGVSGVTAIVYLGTPYVLVAFIGVGLWGVATAVIAGPSRTLIQRASPERVHGRVLAADLMAGSTAELVGIATAGALVAAFGVQWAILILGCGVTIFAVHVHLRDRQAADQQQGVLLDSVDA